MEEVTKTEIQYPALEPQAFIITRAEAQELAEILRFAAQAARSEEGVLRGIHNARAVQAANKSHHLDRMARYWLARLAGVGTEVTEAVTEVIEVVSGQF